MILDGQLLCPYCFEPVTTGGVANAHLVWHGPCMTASLALDLYDFEATQGDSR